MKRILMFDYDGVIADSLAYFADKFCTACRLHGYAGFETTTDFLNLFDINVFEGMTAAGIPAAEIPAILKTMEEVMSASRATYDVFPDMPDILRRLAVANRLFVITSNVSSRVRRDMQTFRIEGIEAILGSDIATSKVAKIKRIITANPGAASYYIGDTRGDMLEAHAAGVDTVAVTWGWHTAAKLAATAPDQVVDRPVDLLRLFET